MEFLTFLWLSCNSSLAEWFYHPTFHLFAKIGDLDNSNSDSVTTFWTWHGGGPGGVKDEYANNIKI